jgi:malonate transporter and related proteins
VGPHTGRWEGSLTLLQTMAPIFGLMVLGFIAVRIDLMEQAGVKGLVLFVFNFSIPALLLTSMAALELPSDMDWGFLAAFYGASVLVYAMGVTVGRFAFGRTLADQAIFGMGAAFSNLVLMGIPIILTALGPEALLPMLVIIGFHSATFMPVTVVLIQVGRGGPETVTRRLVRVFGDVVRNPIILGIFAGLVMNLLNVSIWVPVARLLEILGAAAVPCALFAMGASIADYPLSGDLRPAAALSVLKLVVHPILVWLIAVPLLGLEGLWVSVAVVMSSMPSAVNVYLFGSRYDAAQSVAARTVLLSTACSMLTISVVLALTRP